VSAVTSDTVPTIQQENRRTEESKAPPARETKQRRCGVELQPSTVSHYLHIPFTTAVTVRTGKCAVHLVFAVRFVVEGTGALVTVYVPAA
jgi:hypothetical protein